MLSKQRILEIFKETEVMQEGHFLLTSGRHSKQYLQCAQLFQYPAYSELLCKELAEKLRYLSVDLVIGPAIGGVIISYEMGRLLNVKTIFAERENGVMTLRRGFMIPPGARVLVVEDVITTGGSVMEVVKLVKEAGAQLAGVGVIVDRTGGKADFGADFASVISLEVQSYRPEECPLCTLDLPLVKPGSRKMK